MWVHCVQGRIKIYPYTYLEFQIPQQTVTKRSDLSSRPQNNQQAIQTYPALPSESTSYPKIKLSIPQTSRGPNSFAPLWTNRSRWGWSILEIIISIPFPLLPLLKRNSYQIHIYNSTENVVLLIGFSSVTPAITELQIAQVKGAL